jgi:hypothetical protein
LEFHPLGELKHERILIPGLCGGEVQFALLGFIGQALRIRGAKVTALMCDELLPACTLRKVDHQESACSRWCHKNSGPFARAMKLSHRWYSEFITAEKMQEAQSLAREVPVEEIAHFCYRDIDVGELIDRSLESFFLVGRVDIHAPQVQRKSREFLLASLYLTEIGYRVLDELRIDKVLLEDGTKTDWGVIRAVALHLGIPVDLVAISPRGERVVIEWDHPPHSPDSMPAWADWKDLALSHQQEAELDEYMAYRERVPKDGTTFSAGTRSAAPEEVRRQLGLPEKTHAGPLIFAMFTNVGYEARLGIDRPAFDTASAWLSGTVEFFRRWPRHHLIVRVHPGEMYWGARDSVLDCLADYSATLPPNVHLAMPDSPLTAQSVVKASDIVLVYASTVAVEAAALGKPVILIGGGWHAGRGFTVDVTTPQQYFDRLQQVCDGRETLRVPLALARRYAYAFLFRAALPTEFFSTHDVNVSKIRIDSVNDLAPGRDESMDSICQTILLDRLPGRHDAPEAMKQAAATHG